MLESCSTIYQPSSINTPLLSKKGDTQNSVYATSLAYKEPQIFYAEVTMLES